MVIMDKCKLIEIWTALESLVVSLDRIGSYEVDNGNDAARQALDEFFVPENCLKFSHARMLMNELIENEFPGTSQELEKISEDEKSIGYWQYTSKK